MQPLLVADYAFARNKGDDALVTLLIARLYPYGVYFVVLVPNKGIHQFVIDRFARFMNECGLIKFSYRADREPSILAMIDAACKLSGQDGHDVTPPELRVQREDKDTPIIDLSGADVPAAEEEIEEAEPPKGTIIACPELSHPGESQSNGKAEAAVKTVVNQARTLKVALEARMKRDKPFPYTHPIVAWIFEHAAWVLTKYQVNREGRTPYGLLHGIEARERLAEFGETILFYLPKKHRAKMDARWRFGIFLGRSLSSDQNIIGLSDGSVTRARAMVREIPSLRWSLDRVDKLVATPIKEKVQQLDDIEAEASPHEHDQAEQPAEEVDSQRARRRLKIELKDLGLHGFTKGCRKCLLHSQGRHSAAHKEHHTEQCRARIYMRMKEAGVPKYLQAEKEDLERLKSKAKTSKDAKEATAAAKDNNVATEPTEADKVLPPPEAAMDETTAEDGKDEDIDAPDPESQDNGADEPTVRMAEQEDSTNFYEEVNDDIHARTAMDEDSRGPDASGMNVDYLALMDTLQCLGVNPVQASRYVASIIRSKPSLMEFYGIGNISRQANSNHRNLNILGKEAFDLRTHKPSGEPWNFSLAADRKLAWKIVREEEPDWIIGCPPCTAFCALMHLNYTKWTDRRVQAYLAEGRLHLHFVLSLYHYQLKRGKHFLHEHPETATSWKDAMMIKLLSHPRVGTTVADQCQYGLESFDSKGKGGPCKKPTKFASSSPQMLQRLSKRCPGNHVHQHLVGGRAKQAAYYPSGLIEAILRGIRDTADHEALRERDPDCPEHLLQAVLQVGQFSDQGLSVQAKARAEEIRSKLHRLKVPFKHHDGRVEYLSLKFRDSYRDEYTNDVLPHDHLCEAIADEVQYLCKEVLEGVPIEQAKQDPDHILVGGRWINSNKEDMENPKCRARYVAQEVNYGGEADAAFYAATPPLEAKRVLFSTWSKQRHRGGQPLKLHFLDVRKAYFNGRPQRAIYLRLPPELGLGKNIVGKLKRCVYGTRDAGAIWEQVYTRALLDMGFRQGTSSPCCFTHEEWGYP